MRGYTFTVWLTAIITVLTDSPVSAAAVPYAVQHAHLDRRAAPYPDDAAIRSALTNFQGPAVFFSNLAPLTQAQRDAPDTFAESVKGRTVKAAFGNQPFPRETKLFTDQWPGQGRAQNYQDFADRFSRIFAERATGDTAFVLLREISGPLGPKSNSVWIVHELPALKANPNIQKIVRVNPSNFNDRQQIFPATSPETTVPVDSAAADSAPQVKPRKLGGFKLSSRPKPVKPIAAPVAAPARPPPSKAAPPPPPAATSKPSAAPRPSPTSSVVAPAPTTTPSAPVSSVAKSTSTSAPDPTTSAPSISSGSTSVSSVSSSAGSTSSSSISVTSTSSSLASSTTSSSSTTTSTASASVVLDWDSPKDGPYYSAFVL